MKQEDLPMFTPQPDDEKEQIRQIISSVKNFITTSIELEMTLQRAELVKTFRDGNIPESEIEDCLSEIMQNTRKAMIAFYFKQVRELALEKREAEINNPPSLRS